MLFVIQSFPKILIHFSVVRKLQDFESPFISLKSANKPCPHRIVLRKSYWEPGVDDDLIEDRIAMNLLHVQAVNDVERGWIMANKDQLKQLSTLQQRNSRKEVSVSVGSWGFRKRTFAVAFGILYKVVTGLFGNSFYAVWMCRISAATVT